MKTEKGKGKGKVQKSKKAPMIERILEDLFGRTTAINSNTCCICKGPASEFRDKKSKKEYSISGMCQGCQDGVFAPARLDLGPTSMK